MYVIIYTYSIFQRSYNTIMKLAPLVDKNLLSRFAKCCFILAKFLSTRE